MVLLGGLELVAAGYVLNELNKDPKKDGKKHRSDSRDRRHRKEHRKHSHRYDSPDPTRPSRPPQRQDGLRPPQSAPPRPYSAPPPGSRPSWQQQPFHGQPQQWQPNPGAYHSQQHGPPPVLNPYPAQQMPNHPPPQIPRPSINIPPLHVNPAYPPPGTYIDMKTGKIQHNLYPPGHEAARSSQTLSTEGGHHDIGFSNVVVNAMEQRRVASPRPGYTELDSETPGRYRPYDEKRNDPPPPYQEYH